MRLALALTALAWAPFPLALLADALGWEEAALRLGWAVLAAAPFMMLSLVGWGLWWRRR